MWQQKCQCCFPFITAALKDSINRAAGVLEVCRLGCVWVTVYDITDEALSGSGSIKASGERSGQASRAIKRKEGGLFGTERVSTQRPALYVFIQRLFCPCHTLTCRHQTFPPLLHHPPPSSLFTWIHLSRFWFILQASTAVYPPLLRRLKYTFLLYRVRLDCN